MLSIAGKKNNVLKILGTILLLAGGWILSGTNRTQGEYLIVSLLLSFSGYFLFIAFQSTRIKHWIALIFILGVILRSFFFTQAPELSDDYLRYLWDGKVVEQGIDPYAFTPDELILTDSLNNPALISYRDQLKTPVFSEGMNSPKYYSVYPPVAQSLFYIAVHFSRHPNGAVTILRTIEFLFDIGIFFLLIRILKQRGREVGLVAMYWLNPLVVAEFIGNLHLEGIALFFILLTFTVLEQKKTALAGIPLALAVVTKLNPLFLLGVSFRNIKFTQLILFGAITVGLVFLLFIPFTTLENFGHLLQSLRLYSNWFEFNAGIYYLLLDLQHALPKSNIVGMYNFLLPFILITGFVVVNILPKQLELLERYFLIYLFYLLISKIVHPWYLIPLIGLTPLVKWRFSLVWSFLAMFVYLTFNGGQFHEVRAFMHIEYLIVFLLLFVEFYILPKAIRTL